MTPEAVGAFAVAAIERGDFFVLTHPEWKVIEGFFFQRLTTEDGNDAASVAASFTSTR